MWLVLTAIGCSFFRTEPLPPPGVCKLGPAQACYDAGMRHLRGEVLDLAAAARRFDEACQDQHYASCVNLGLQLQDGRGIPRDLERAKQLYQVACTAGHGVGCLNLAFLYDTGNAGPADPVRAGTYFDKALQAFQASCSEGSEWVPKTVEPTACTNLGYLLEHGFGVTLPDPHGALAAYRVGCEHDEAPSCVNLSQLELEQGAPDVGLAVSRLEKACGATSSGVVGSGEACAALAQLHVKGAPGVALDLSRALALNTRGCLLGEARACGAAGAMLMLDEGISPDPARANAAQERGCALGLASSCRVLGEEGLDALLAGRPADLTAIALYFEAACRIGDGQACGRLGALHEQGAFGTDTTAAHRWYDEGCRRRDPSCCVALLKADQPLPLTDSDRDSFLEEACRQGIPRACTANAPAAP